MLDVPAGVPLGSPVTLDGSRSSDIGGDVFRYEWRKLSGPGNGGILDTEIMVITDSSSFVDDSYSTTGTVTYELKVVDTSGNVSSPVQVEVEIYDLSEQRIQVDYLDDGNLLLSWPAYLSGLDLFYSPVLGPFAKWTKIDPTPVRVGTEIQTTLRLADPSGFFVMGSSPP